MLNRVVDRATYDTIKANCAATINQRMTILGLTPSAVQKASQSVLLEFMQGKTTDELSKAVPPAGITMQDLYHYRACISLPKGSKLETLAKILKVEPGQLVPAKYQGEDVRVARRMKSRAGAKAKVEVIPAPEAGYSYLQTNGLLPTELAYKVAAMLVKHFNHYDYKRMRPELSDAEVKEALARIDTVPE